MMRSLVLAAAALTLSSAVAFAHNGPATSGYANDGVRAPAKSRHIARHERAKVAKQLYDYAPEGSFSYTTIPLILGVAY